MSQKSNSGAIPDGMGLKLADEVLEFSNMHRNNTVN
jgi:hypothetical protein